MTTPRHRAKRNRQEAKYGLPPGLLDGLASPKKGADALVDAATTRTLKRKLTPNEVVSEFVHQAPDRLDKFAPLMEKIAERESSLETRARNDGLNTNGTVDHGLYQVNDIWRNDPVIGPLFKSGAIYTKAGATKAAIRILEVQGPKAWATFKPGVDEKYIGKMPAGPLGTGGTGGSGGGARPTAGTPMKLNYGTESIEAPDPELLRKQFFAQWYASKHPDSLLVKLGAVDPAMSTTSTLKLPTVTGFSPARPGRTTVRLTGDGPDVVAGGRAAVGGVQKALQWATKRIGRAETAGENRSPWIDHLQSQFGMTGQAWCSMFTTLAVVKGGAPRSAMTPRVADVRAWAGAKTNGYLGFVGATKGRPGDLLLFGNDHIGMVERVTKNGYVMVAGNDSDRVNRRTVSFGSADIVRPAYGKGKRR